MTTGHSSHWGLSLLQDLLEEQHGRAQAAQEISAVHWEGSVVWTWDGLIMGDAAEIWTGWVDYRVSGKPDFTELAFWHFIASFQQALCISYRKKQISAE